MPWIHVFIINTVDHPSLVHTLTNLTLAIPTLMYPSNASSPLCPPPNAQAILDTIISAGEASKSGGSLSAGSTGNRPTSPLLEQCTPPGGLQEQLQHQDLALPPGVIDPGESMRRKMLALLALDHAANLENIASSSTTAAEAAAAAAPGGSSPPQNEEKEKRMVTFGGKSNIFPIQEDHTDTSHQV